jgi:hypothetical protein
MSNLQGKYHSLHQQLGEHRKVTWKSEKFIKFQFNGDNRRVDWVHKEWLANGFAAACAVNSRYRFLVRREGESQPFILRGIDLKNQEKIDATLTDVELFLTSPFALHPGIHRIKDLLADPDTHVMGFETGVREGGETLRVLTLDFGNPKLPVKSATIHLDPRNDWCIREYEALDRNGILPYRSTISYGSQPAGASFPHEIFYEFYIENENGAGGETMTESLTELAVCKSPERAFSLTSFGLPEPASAGGTRSWLTGTSFFAIGAALAASGAVVLWVATRLRKR